MKFVLQIELGNDAMQTALQLAERLHLVANQIQMRNPNASIMAPDAETMRISDENGNTVGMWEVTA